LTSDAFKGLTSKERRGEGTGEEVKGGKGVGGSGERRER